MCFHFSSDEWVESVSNHFWWSLVSSRGNPVEFVEKFESIVLHVINKHHWVGNTHFKKCAHGIIVEDEQRKKKWMKADSKAYEEFKKIIVNKNVRKDLLQMGEGVHTTLLEVIYLFCYDSRMSQNDFVTHR